MQNVKLQNFRMNTTRKNFQDEKFVKKKKMKQGYFLIVSVITMFGNIHKFFSTYK